MRDVSRSVEAVPLVRQRESPDARADGPPVRTPTGPDRPEAGAPPRVSRRFIALYTLAFISTTLLFLAPQLVTLALKVNALVGTEQAPNSLSLVAGVGALLAMVSNPFFGRLSDRTSSRFGMRRPWIVGGLLGGSLGVLVVALAPNVPVVLLGWCIAQVCFNALLAALVAVLPDQVPPAQRGSVAGVLGIGVVLMSPSSGPAVSEWPCADVPRPRDEKPGAQPGAAHHHLW